MTAPMPRDEKNRRCLLKYGCTADQWDEILAVRRSMRKAEYSPAKLPHSAYVIQRSNAGLRGIGFELTVWEWWCIWRDSGHWYERGHSGFHMCRKGDLGPYAVGNVFIGPSSTNVSEAHRRIDIGLPVGVKRHRHRFTARRTINGKEVHIGSFASPELARAAYLAAVPIRSSGGACA